MTGVSRNLAQFTPSLPNEVGIHCPPPAWSTASRGEAIPGADAVGTGTRRADRAGGWCAADLGDRRRSAAGVRRTLARLARAGRLHSETLIWSTPYILAGLAVGLAFRGGLFNIGAEG